MHQGVSAVERMGNKIVVQARMNALVEVLAGFAIGLVVLYAGWRSLSFGQKPGDLFIFIDAPLAGGRFIAAATALQL